jgi:hypothetical protein
MKDIETDKAVMAEQLAKEAELLKQSDPDRELKEIFEAASLQDLQKYLEE